MLRPICVSVFGLLLSACSVFGVRSGYEQPSYEVLRTLDDGVEIRRYSKRLVAETRVEPADPEAGNGEAFRVLAAYIFGENQTREKVSMTSPVEVARASEEISMTAPVETRRDEAGLTMRFFLPSRWSLDTVPEPTNPEVRVVEVPAETVAVLRFSGLGRVGAVEARTDELLTALSDAGLKSVAEPVAYLYDPPWTLPFLRRNEVVVRVAAP